jgi:hypothetical protein
MTVCHQLVHSKKNDTRLVLRILFSISLFVHSPFALQFSYASSFSFCPLVATSCSYCFLGLAVFFSVATAARTSPYDLVQYIRFVPAGVPGMAL